MTDKAKTDVDPKAEQPKAGATKDELTDTDLDKVSGGFLDGNCSRNTINTSGGATVNSQMVVL